MYMYMVNHEVWEDPNSPEYLEVTVDERDIIIVIRTQE